MLTSVVEDISLAVSRNIVGAEVLHELLSAPWLHALLKIYECLLQFGRSTPSPLLPCALGLSHEIMATIQMVHRPSAEARELYSLLSSPHMQALLSSQDSVAQSDYGPVLPPLPDDMPEGEETMRVVCLVKNNQPLGATIRRDEETGEIYMARVIHGELADRSGLLYPGDLLVEVNGSPVVGMEPGLVVQILMISQGTILFKVIPDRAQSSPRVSRPAGGRLCGAGGGVPADGGQVQTVFRPHAGERRPPARLHAALLRHPGGAGRTTVDTCQLEE
ncbi:MAGUK p55 subfamily member 4-like [Pseudoliparis swirei]|uniref:MAGUK p55 subfamily member 4-like n=1 Tax=Pseudoliparis swirei TaxID=2059687 RepID=UPI0024BE19C6|nr:MAGUK p55 subfamily member 4-like [Pseudoliparis swirei]